MMIIAIDYDGTFAADPPAWADAIRALMLAGHTVICVTGRGGDPDWESPVRAAFAAEDLAHVPIVFAALAWKADAARAAGWDVDVWIDDHPEAIHAPQRPVRRRRRVDR